MSIKAFLIERPDQSFSVGSREKGAMPGGADYLGPTADIWADKDWIHICTDSYEGHASLNIEALPLLRRALTKIARQQRVAKP